MMEMIIVVIVLGLLATAIVPRMAGTDARRARITHDATVDLLTVLAYRTAISLHPLGLEYDADARLLRIVTLSVDEQTGRPQWRADRLSTAVQFPLDVQIADCRAAGRLIKESSWLIEFPVEEPRPELSLHLVGPKLDVVCMLETHATAAKSVRLGEEIDDALNPIDLDAIGRGLQSW